MFIAGIILCIIFIIYGIFIGSAGSGSMFFVVWFVLGLACLALALGDRFGVWQQLPNVLIKLSKVVAAVVVIVLVIVEGMIFSGFGKTGEPGLDAIIVLGAQVREDGPSRVLKFRLDKAIEYLNENPGTICIVSGGKGSNEIVTEAEGMADYLVKNGINKDRIVLEDKSVNTAQNIAFSMQKADLNGKKVGIVTNNFHVFRALNTAKKQGLEGAVGIAAASSPPYLPNNMFREFFGVMKSLL